MRYRAAEVTVDDEELGGYDFACVVDSDGSQVSRLFLEYWLAESEADRMNEEAELASNYENDE